MVKADVKRDYYADLDLPPTADSEEVKRQFRLLAKQYHPDRNPGHEAEVVPKFQAVQAAHEILIDPVEKLKYDQGRAKLAAKNATTYASDPYTFARSNPPKPTTAGTPFNFPPPKQKERRSPFPPPNQKPASAGAGKFEAWARPAPNANAWDRSRFEAEAARGFSNMRQSQNPPQMPPRTTRQHPTAPKQPPPAETAHVPNGPPTSFPGLSRTQSARKTTGYMPGAYGNADEPAAPRTSAYAHVRAERPYAPQPPNIHVSEPYNTRSPPVSRARPTVSPLRHTRSSDHEMRSEHVSTSRPSAKYGGLGGERIDIHDDGLHRSASVRNSPVEPAWEDRGPFGRNSARYEHVPRHRSASPKVRSTGVHADYSSSSGEEEVVQMGSRPKATPKSRPKPQTGPSFQAFADDDPALTGHFPSTNYTKVVNDSQHHYPPPEPREHTRKPWTDMASPDELPRTEFDGRGGNMDGPKYASTSLNQSPHPWSHYCGPNRTQRGQSFNGIPIWAVPSTVYPQRTPPRTEPQETGRRAASDAITSSDLPRSSRNTFFNEKFTNRSVSHNEKPAHHVNGTFVASEWHDKVTSDDFRPTLNDTQLRKSPSKTSRTAKPVTRGRGLSRAADQEGHSSSESSAGPRGHQAENKPRDDPPIHKAAAFQPGKLAGDWASNLKSSAGRGDGRAASHQGKDDSSSASSREPYVVVEEDVMDVDDQPVTGNGHHRTSTNGMNQSVRDSSRRSSKRQSMNGGVDLSDLAKHAPFTAKAGGLKDMDELAANLPFESRAEKNVDLERKQSNNKNPRPLAMPRPPRAVVPPAEDRLTPDNFTQYCQNMAAYMKEWNNFNASMLEHFRHRQDMVCGNMLDNWITIRSDGPDAHEEDGDTGIGLTRSRSSSYAGYATYMQWLQEDAKCREWWDHANELHMKCVEDLGRIREKAKNTFR